MAVWLVLKSSSCSVHLCLVLLQMELCRDLMIAAKAGDEEETKRLIEEGVDVNHQNEVNYMYV